METVRKILPLIFGHMYVFMYVCIAQQDLYANEKNILGLAVNNNRSNLVAIETASRLYKPGNGSTNPFSYALSNWLKLSPAVKSALSQQLTTKRSAPPVPTPGSLAMTGSVTISGNIMTLALPTNINQMTIVMPITITVPKGGSLAITVNGAPYTSPIPGLTVQKTGAANTFTLGGDFSVSSGTIVIDTGKTAIVNGLLSYNGSDILGTSFTNNGTITADGDISITRAYSSTRNAVTAGNISSTTGNIVISNNAATGNFNGVYSNGTVSTIGSKALTFANNSSTGIQGVLTDSAGTIESGTINFTNNIGNDSSYGFEVSGNVFTNQVSIMVDFSSTNQDYSINSTIYEYTNQTTPLPDSQIHITNTDSSGGSLTMTGSVTISGNIMTLALPTSISDMTIVAPTVVITVPTGGSLAITVSGAPYTSPIPGLTVEATGTANTFTIGGNFSVTAPATGGVYANIPAGATLNIARALTFNGGPDESNRYGSVFNAGTITASSHITMNYNQGASMLAGVENRGTIESILGNIEMNYNIGIDGGAGVGGSRNTNVAGGIIIATAGNITMNNNTGGGANFTGAGIGGGAGISNNIGGGGNTITAIIGNITMNNNASIGGVFGGAGIGGGSGGFGGVGGVGSTVTAVAGNIDMSNNIGGAGVGAGAGIGGGGGIGGAGGTIVATAGNIIMNNNIGGAGTSGGTVAGNGGAGATITATIGSIIMKNNTGGAGASFGGGGAGIGGGSSLFGGGAGIGGGSSPTSGGIGSNITANSGTIEDNIGGSGFGGSGGGAGFGGGGGGASFGGGRAGGAGATYSLAITIGLNTGGTATGGGSNGADNGAGGNGSDGGGGAGGAAYTGI